MVTATAEELDITVDEELDTADNDVRHLKHSICQPGPGPSIAHCGEPFIATGEIVTRIERTMCKPCVEESLTGICPRCGGRLAMLRF